MWPFGIIDLNCTGAEDSVFNCSYNGTVDFYSCEASHDASVICQGINTYSVHVIKHPSVYWYVVRLYMLQPCSCYKGVARFLLISYSIDLFHDDVFHE